MFYCCFEKYYQTKNRFVSFRLHRTETLVLVFMVSFSLSLHLPLYSLLFQ